MFRKLITESNDNYTKCIIMPTNLPNTAKAIRALPVNEAFTLDQTNSELESYPAAFQNHKKRYL